MGSPQRIKPASTRFWGSDGWMLEWWIQEPEKAEALLQNIQTYGVWAVMAYHLFRLADQQVQEEAELTTEQMFGWEQQGGQQPQMADAGDSDHALVERLAMALDGLMKHLSEDGGGGGWSPNTGL
ncbi:hypothetical protein SARC_09772 [Sphaeroforma arctica JP610]|uniref:Uncharacterized protein n=1 Tax=Sphaeroforma arctica JP610 TaxID=667725 RepID=A0A0L0FLZ9_9EUKA|nr:hypothetical protein SARC_09772 [Sphaeroforma arctica JP610]KNC77780.1 hypothetical protein SARC_09772 [Sphaeroforma arctica JP610]|eukprot:XP_014151682.1 hypothetical protein SARC_09772 [Sphaeroforma arctica JP610]